MLGAGALRHRIRIQQRIGQRDSLGQLIDVWKDVATVWAQVTSATGKEVFAASGFSSQITHTCRLRFRAFLNVTAGMRVLHDGKVLHVQGVSDLDGTRAFATLTLLEIGTGMQHA